MQLCRKSSWLYYKYKVKSLEDYNSVMNSESSVKVR